MNKQFKSILFFSLAVFVFVLAGCKSDKPQQQPTATSYELAMTEHDTATVVGLIDQFFNLAESGAITDAVAMLYQTNDSNVYEEPEPLDNEQIRRMTAMLKSLPIIEHRIDYIKFNEAYSNEAKVTAIIAHAQGNMPEVKTVFYFKPYDYQSDWRLCLVDSHKGDSRVIDNEKADSVADKFSEDMKQKNSTN